MTWRPAFPLPPVKTMRCPACFTEFMVLAVLVARLVANIEEQSVSPENRVIGGLLTNYLASGLCGREV